jgi:ribosomal protein S27AE
MIGDGDSTSDFEVPEELKGILIKEKLVCPECGSEVLMTELKKYFGVCNACYWENNERQM